ncbi:reverse transcriptase domain-containing protein [Tanacetum coccineum]
MTKLTLEESLSMSMAKIAKSHDENTNLIKELRAFTDFALRNQKASIEALEIQTISTSVKADKPSIHPKDLEAYYTDAKPLGKALPQKEKDPGSFTLPCFINNMCFYKSLADLGESVSVMPYSTYTTLGLVDLIPTKLIIELDDRTVKRPKGVVENVLGLRKKIDGMLVENLQIMEI